MNKNTISEGIQLIIRYLMNHIFNDDHLNNIHNFVVVAETENYESDSEDEKSHLNR